MANIETRVNGASSKNGYEFYLNVIVNDEVQNDNTFLVNIDAYIVNHGTRTETGGWDKQTIIQDIGQQTDTNQMLDTNDVPKEGGVTLAIRHYGIYRVPVSKSSIYVTGAMARNGGYGDYDPGYCEAKGWVSMPRAMSTWNTNSPYPIADITQGFTLPITKYVNTYYDVVEVRNENNSTLIKTINNAANGMSVTFTSGELNTIYTMDNNKYQKNLMFYLDLKTYTDSSKTTQIGYTQRLACSTYLPNPYPTATYTIAEQDASVIAYLQGDTTKVIKNASDLLFTISATPKYGALIGSVTVNDAPAVLIGGNYVINVTNVDTGTFIIKIKDSREYPTTYTATKTPLDYKACRINSWSCPRETQTSSNIKLKANITCSNKIGGPSGTTNQELVQYSLDNSTWSTISSGDYTFTDDTITITNLILTGLIPYQQPGKLYLRVIDPLSGAIDNKDISVGIYTIAKGDRKVRINGTLELADSTGSNRINVGDKLIYDEGYNANGYYIRFNSGIMLCCGRTISQNCGGLTTTAYYLTLPQSFKNNDYSITLSRRSGGAYFSSTLERTNNVQSGSFEILVWNNNSSTAEAIQFDYMAMGMWK